MPWPTDPEKLALAKERHRLARIAWWAKPGSRERVSQAVTATCRTPEFRAAAAELKRQHYAKLREKRQARLDAIRERFQVRP